MIIKMPGKIETPSLQDTWTKILGFFNQTKQKKKNKKKNAAPCLCCGFSVFLVAT